MFKRYPWIKHYLFHPIEFFIIVFGVGIAIAWNWVEENEDEIKEAINKFKKFFRRK